VLGADIEINWRLDGIEHTDEDLLNQVKILLNSTLSYNNRKLTDYNIELPSPEYDANRFTDPAFVSAVLLMFLCRTQLQLFDENDAQSDYLKLTDEQKEHYNLFLHAAQICKTDKRAQIYFLDAPGGHGGIG